MKENIWPLLCSQILEVIYLSTLFTSIKPECCPFKILQLFPQGDSVQTLPQSKYIQLLTTSQEPSFVVLRHLPFL